MKKAYHSTSNGLCFDKIISRGPMITTIDMGGGREKWIAVAQKPLKNTKM
jgi:hypothetical protein